MTESLIERAIRQRGGATARAAGLSVEEASAGARRPERMPMESLGDVQARGVIARPRMRPDAKAIAGCEELRVNLALRYADQATMVTLLVGAAPRSGTSTVACNLAASLAREAGSRVLLVDLGAPRRAHGGVDAMGGALALPELIDAHLRPSLAEAAPCVVAVPGTSSSMLSLYLSRVFDEFLDRARERFHHVLIDVPSVDAHPEGLVLVPKADGVVLVVESERTGKHAAQAAKRKIESAGGNLLGVVLNRRRHRIPGWLYRRL